MEREKLVSWIGKYKYPLMILALGLCLMMIPGREDAAPTEQPQVQTITMQESLQRILNQIEGAGRVELLLREGTGSRTLYQTDIHYDASGESESSQEKTVIITDSQHNESGLVLGEDPPVYLGAVVVCQGADRAEVRLAIVEAVRCATGLGANQISVVKMK